MKSKSRINVTIDPDLAQKARRYAAKNRRSLSALVSDVLERHIRLYEGQNIKGLMNMPQYDGPIEGGGFMEWRKNRTAIRVSKSRKSS